MRNRIVLVSASLLLLAVEPNAAMTWQRATVTPNTDQLYEVVWGNGQFVAVGTGPGHVALTSPDGIAWSEHPTGLTDNNAGLHDIVWNGAQFLAVGSYDVSQGVVLTSADGRNWTVRPQSARDLYTVAWNGNSVPNHYLALGPGGGSPPDCLWTWYSTDGSTWISNPVAVSSPNCRPRQIIWTNQFTAVGDLGLIMTSPDGATWTVQASGTSDSLWDIVYASGLYVAVGGLDGTVLTSPDSVTWTPRTSGMSSCTLEGVAHNGTIFIAVGNSCILTSPDGINWHRQSGLPLIPGAGILADVTWSGFRWVAVGTPDLILYSDDTTPVELQSFTVE